MTATKPIKTILSAIFKGFRKGTKGPQVQGEVELRLVSNFVVNSEGELEFGLDVPTLPIPQITGAALEAGFSLTRNHVTESHGVAVITLRLRDEEGADS